MLENPVVTDELFDEIESSTVEQQEEWLFLSQSEEFKGYWYVDGIRSSFFFDFDELIGPYRLVSPSTLNDFIARAEEYGYRVAFMGDPSDILNAYEYLKEPPDVELNSDLDGVIKGFLPWQVAGYNKLVRDESIEAGFFVWTVGSGKTAAMTAAILHHMNSDEPFDIALCVVKSHNKIDTARKLKQLGGIDAVVIDGTKRQRLRTYALSAQADNPLVFVLNYEKFREDYEDLIPLIEDSRCLFFWDEAPTKLSNRSTKLYKSIRKMLYESFPSKPRPSWMRHWALTATPIENSPEDFFSCANLMKPGVLGTVRDFYNKYVGSVNYFSGKPEQWKNLESLEARLQFMTHRVSKDDPEIAKMFPSVVDIPVSIDWNSKHLSIYNKMAGRIHAITKELDTDDVNILSLIQVLQMMCDAPSMIQTSANNRRQFYELLEDPDVTDMPTATRGSASALMLVNDLGIDAFTNDGHTKLDTWLEIITQKHPNDKIVTHSTWSEYIFPVWEEFLSDHGVSYVVYRGTQTEKQRALDTFRNDPSIRCFLSGDAGADSIDISEASVGINYNIPWKWTTLTQREGRRDRVNSAHKQIYTYTLTMPFSVDERKLEVCRRKYQYHAQLFDGKAQDESLSARMTREDLMYLLLGSA